MGKLSPAVHLGRRIWNTKVDNAGKWLVVGGGTSVMTGTVNNLENHHIVNNQKKAQQKAFRRGKSYGRTTAPITYKRKLRNGKTITVTRGGAKKHA